MIFKCSECGGEIKKCGKTYRCTKCGKERIIEEKQIVDMSENANLSVLME